MEKTYALTPRRKKLLERNDFIRDYYARHHRLTYRQMGETFGISKQMVELIVNEGDKIKANGKD